MKTRSQARKQKSRDQLELSSDQNWTVVLDKNEVQKYFDASSKCYRVSNYTEFQPTVDYRSNASQMNVVDIATECDEMVQATCNSMQTSSGQFFEAENAHGKLLFVSFRSSSSFTKSSITTTNYVWDSIL